MKTDGNEPAYPTQMWDQEMKEATWIDGGLTKREHFAAMAMQGLIGCSDKLATARGQTLGERVSELSVYYADALIEALNKEEE